MTIALGYLLARASDTIADTNRLAAAGTYPDSGAVSRMLLRTAEAEDALDLASLLGGAGGRSGKECC